MEFLLIILGFAIFAASIYFLQDYIKCIREKNKEPKALYEISIFLTLILGSSLFAYSCYLIGKS
jgi:hypothetical protein